VARDRPGRALRRFETSQIRPCPESFEDGLRRLELEPGCLVVAERTTRIADEHAHARSLIRRVEAPPEIERAAKWIERRVRAAFGDSDRAVGLRNHRAEHVSVEGVPCRGHEDSVAESLSNLEGLTCGRIRRVGESLIQLPLGDRNGQIAALDPVVVRDQPLASRRPGVRPTALSNYQECDRKPERTARGARSIARLDMDAVEAFDELLKLVVVSGEVGGSRQTVEIIDRERRGLIRAEESAVSLLPGAASITRTAVFKMIHVNQARTEPCAGSCL
jgi:hypothetical protein